MGKYSRQKIFYEVCYWTKFLQAQISKYTQQRERELSNKIKTSTFSEKCKCYES